MNKMNIHFPVCLFVCLLEPSYLQAYAEHKPNAAIFDIVTDDGCFITDSRVDSTKTDDRVVRSLASAVAPAHAEQLAGLELFTEVCLAIGPRPPRRASPRGAVWRGVARVSLSLSLLVFRQSLLLPHQYLVEDIVLLRFLPPSPCMQRRRETMQSWRCSKLKVPCWR